jgi:hypothetical protein
MSRKTYERPFKLDMDFGEAVQRFAQTKSHEVERLMAENKGRVQESDLVLPTLRIMAERKDGFITTKELIGELQDLFNPTGQDAEILDGRADTYFSQKVRNLASHRATSNSFVTNGFAEYDGAKHGFRITGEGRALLKKLNG